MLPEGRLNVLHVIHRIGDGGADHALTRLVNHSDPDRFHHHVLALHPGPGYEPFRPEVTIVDARSSDVMTVLRTLRACVPSLDIVHGWVSEGTILAAQLAASLGVPLVARQPTNMEAELAADLKHAATYWPRLRPAFQAASVVVSPSPALFESTYRSCGVVQTAVPNAVDVEQFKTYEGRSIERPFTMALVGRLCRQKDPLTLVEALGRLTRHHKWQLSVYGEGHLRAAMEDRLAALGIRDRVSFKGFDARWHERVDAIDAFVMPTLYEGMSNALLEAAASALPIVTTSIPENLAVLQPDLHALMTSPGSVGELATALRLTIERPEDARKRGLRAREHVRRFSVAAMVAGHEDIYDQLCGRCAARAA